MSDASASPTIVGIELGGTKSIAVLGHGGIIRDRRVVATSDPDKTFRALRKAIFEWQSCGGIDAIGIAAFGPVRVDRTALDYGTMLATPKSGWAGAKIAKTLTDGFAVPWLLDTDVNAAALAETRWGAGQGLASICYLTIGTGVGGGLVIDGQPVHGALHPEIGHIKLRRADGDNFGGTCPFHGDCAEGLLSGPALQARFGMPAELVDDGDQRWALVAHDFAQLIAAISLTTCPQRILIGGGVGLGRASLLPLVRNQVLKTLGGYLPHITPESISPYVTIAGLTAEAGPLGAIALGEIALEAVASAAQKGGSR